MRFGFSRPCLWPGCALTTPAGSYCAAHRRARKRVRNADAVTAKAVVAASPACACVDPACSVHPGGACGATTDLTAEHVWPLEHGGRHDGERRTACRRCNSAKGSRLPR